MYCQICGSTITDGIAYCPVCGAPLTQTNMQPTIPMQPNNQQMMTSPITQTTNAIPQSSNQQNWTVTPIQNYNTNSTIPPKTKSNTPIIISIIVGLVLLIVLGLFIGTSIIGKANGTYKLSLIKAMGVTYTVEEFEEYGDVEFDITLTIKNNRGTLKMNMDGDIETDSGKIRIKDDEIHFLDINGNPAIIADYDEEDGIITIKEDEVSFVLEKE